MIWLYLTLPGLVTAYALFLRPFLHGLPKFQRFYDEADGFWEKVWALCGKSATIAFAYTLQAVSWALQWIDPLAAAVGDPDLRAQITAGISADPKVLGYFSMAVSFLIIASRLRSLAKSV